MYVAINAMVVLSYLNTFGSLYSILSSVLLCVAVTQWFIVLLTIHVTHEWNVMNQTLTCFT